jgi:sugar lactone lactonase YvrE
VTFTGVSLGSYTGHVTAFDAGGAPIGKAEVGVVVESTDPVVVTADVKLDPNYVPAPPAPNTFPNGGGGSGANPTADLAIGVNLHDGIDLWGITNPMHFATDFEPDRVREDHGTVWSLSNRDGQGLQVQRWSLDGTLLGTTAISALLTDDVEFATDGTAWIPTTTGIRRVTPDGQALPAFAREVDGTRLARDPDGTFLVTGFSRTSITRLGQDGNLMEEIPVADTIGLSEIAVDSQHRIWVAEVMGRNVYVVAPDGTTLGKYASPQASDLEVEMIAPDDQGHAWCTLNSGHTHVMKLDTDGSVLSDVDVGYYPLGPRVDGNGDLWVVAMDVAPHHLPVRHQNGLAHIKADGSLVGFYGLPPSVGVPYFSFAGNNTFWIGGMDLTVNGFDIDKIGI